MTVDEIMVQLKEWGNENTVRIFKNHGAKDPIYGVKVADLKKIVKKVKKDHTLALQLWDTGNSDAQYLAGLIADETKVTKQELQKWAREASWYMLSDYVVATVASECAFGLELAREWIKSDRQLIASAGWSTFSGWLAIKGESAVDLDEIKVLLGYVEKNIHQAKNRARYSMNGFVIAVGGYIPALSDEAIAISKKIGKVKVYMGKTSCKVPYAPEYIVKMIARGTLGKLRKAARC
jgi:3-methyladenine DNA glycosylase AlkD